MLAMNHRDRVAIKATLFDADDALALLTTEFVERGNVSGDTLELAADACDRIDARINPAVVTPRVGEFISMVLDIVRTACDVVKDGDYNESAVTRLRFHRARIDSMRSTINTLFPG